MANYLEKAEILMLEVVPLRAMVAFPGMPMNVEIAEEAVATICEKAYESGNPLLFLSQTDIAVTNPTTKDFATVGTVVKIEQFLKTDEGNVRLLAHGMDRAQVLQLSETDGKFTAKVLQKQIVLEGNGGLRAQALMRQAREAFFAFAELLPKVSAELKLAVKALDDPSELADFVAANILISDHDKQQILDEFDPLKRLEKLALLLEAELELLKEEKKIHREVRKRLDERQKEYYLQEQLKVIQNELGGAEDDEEIIEYAEKIEKANLPKEVRENLEKELRKLAKTPFNSAESTVLRSYLDTCLELPWDNATLDRTDVAFAKKILDDDHYGLEKIKERILEFLAVKQLNSDLNSQILCLVGPPGTGKTSIAASLARAMNREYVRVSLGGIRDEADIRGHRKTYIGAMPGRIVNALTKAKVKNPLILLDEIDKLTRDNHGDPASALLEVLDSEQNKNFRDHFIEMPIDLSECVFVATANTLDTIPRPLLDRMELIHLSSYTRQEKLEIAKRHLLPKQRKRHGLTANALRIKDDAIYEIIDAYTAEAGVRNLERALGTVCRKVAKGIVDGTYKSKTLTQKNVKDFLTGHPIPKERIFDADCIGVVNGLAYTEVGGDLLRIEAAAMQGSGKIQLTGSLGDVMKESAQAAVSYIRAHAEELGVAPDFYKEKDLHIHVPEGAVPKDGPSAGVTMVTALVSELTQKPVRRDVAMTGEVTLRGRVLPIGGLKEKTMAAYQAGVKCVLIPKENVCDLQDLDQSVRNAMEFIPCTHMEDVLKAALR